MAGFGHEGVQPVQVNAPPLVAPAAPVATGSAVQALVDSFRNGAINADDVARVVGVNPLKQKAEIQGLNELLSPQAIAARQAGINLQGAQATAQLPLVEPTAQLAASKTQREIADTKYGGGVSAYQQFAPLSGKPAVIKDASGNPDWDAMGQAGQGLLGASTQQNFARVQLEPARTEEAIDPVTRRKYTRTVNKWGVDISTGSDEYKRLTGIINRTNDSIFGGTPGTATTTPAAAAPQSSASPEGTGLQAQLVNLGLMPASAAAKESDADAADIIASFKAKQLPAAPAPVIEPAAAPNEDLYKPGLGRLTALGPNEMSVPDIAADLRKQPQYDLWAKAAPDVQAFLTTADKIRNIPEAKQRAGKADMNTLDMDLAERIIKMEDPGNAIREFKWDKLVQGVPLYDRLKNFKAEALRTGAMTPEKRKQLISLGEEVLAGRERAVKPLLELAQNRAKASSAPLDQIFTSLDQKILHGGTLVPGHAASAPSAKGELVTIPGRGTGYLDRATGMFTPQ